ncbi:cation-transporting P-type ATPase [Haliangium sp. UPWRP_2]|uniref:cation-translocating P-type ATPase n=1 Tax=Haliangium sp. UPWRP_2 TaxID=1931276 RepID=UPI000B543979|nr:cation-transporting P-type ATPase [Haliangium sp. UPWRP_2]PSM31966.1 cation-translocating P-type ATPase [Haliangium sp. UPWRP_2]
MSADPARVHKDEELPPDAHGIAISTLRESLGVDPAVGLPDAEVLSRRSRFGENRLPEPPRESEIRRFLRQLQSPLVLVLIAAAAIATVIGAMERSGSILTRFGDALAIILIVLLNALLGFFQERRAESALRALSSMSVPRARVLRAGVPTEIPAVMLVPGDIIALEAGDAVPADARLLVATDLRVDESALTGESAPVDKDAGRSLAPDVPLAERVTMAYLGTLVVHGKGQALIVATGAQTELGRIAKALGNSESEETPLEATLRVFGRRVLWVCVLVSALLFGWGVTKGGDTWSGALLQAVSFAVALIPEGLPAITAIALALGTQRMARLGVIVRRLPAVEALGATSVICSDKTGTLTQNRMTVRVLYAAGARHEAGPASSAAVRELLLTAVLCNDARFTPDPKTGTQALQGDPTEGALLTAAKQGGLVPESLRVERPRLAEIPFDSERKRMSVLVRESDGSRTVHLKGSAETVLPGCTTLRTADGERPMSDADRKSILEEVDRMSEGALRVLVFASKRQTGDTIEEAGLTFLGLIGMIDPPREGVTEAIAACHQAGVAVVMITGDHPRTAAAIAREIGLLRAGDETLTGTELSRLTDDALRERCARVRVFARTTAEQKLRIVHAFQSSGHVVAMTGDGVNDAPALHEAHVGVAMGRGGTEVARQAAGVVLTDDNFATIVSGIREGRAIYHNIQKFIVYLLSSNVALALAVFGATFHNGCLPLTPLMILCINLVTNGLPALALGIEPPDPAQMQTPPRRSATGLFGTIDYVGILLAGLLMGVFALMLYARPWLDRSVDPPWSRAMAFAVLGFGPLFHAWNCRSRDRSLFSLRPLLPMPLVGACLLSAGVHLISSAVPALRPVFHTYPLSASDWLIVVVLSASVLPLIELAKLIGRPLLRRQSSVDALKERRLPEPGGDQGGGR